MQDYLNEFEKPKKKARSELWFLWWMLQVFNIIQIVTGGGIF